MFKLYVNGTVVWETEEPVAQIFASSPYGKATFRLGGSDPYFTLILLNSSSDKISVETKVPTETSDSEAATGKQLKSGENTPLTFNAEDSSDE